MESSRLSKLMFASALLYLGLAIGCGMPTYKDSRKDDLDFNSGFSFDPSGRYGIQVLDIDFQPKQTKLYLRVLDRAEGQFRPDSMQKFESKSIDPSSTMLYVGSDRREKKQLVGKFYREGMTIPKTEWEGRELKEKDDHILLTFEPVAAPADQDVFKLQFLDFPELNIQRTNRPSFIASLWTSVPAWLPFVVLLVAMGATYLFLHIYYPQHAATLREEAQRIASGADHSKSASPLTPKSEDERKRDDALERNRRDVQFKETLKLSKELHTIEAIQEWSKQQRWKVLDDKTLSADEAEERLEQIDTTTKREKQRLKDDVEIFEGD